VKHLYFCRHGRSEGNEAGVYSGHTDTPLTAEGRAQAKLAGEYATQLHIDHIIASPLSRAHDTARLIAQEIGYPEDKIELNSLIMERNFGSLEGTAWSPDFNVDGIADVETHESLQTRVQLAYKYIQSLPVENVLVVSHGATGRMFRHVVDPSIPYFSDDPVLRLKYRFENAQIVQLV
jgi:uncharacterized phosphatase